MRVNTPLMAVIGSLAGAASAVVAYQAHDEVAPRPAAVHRPVAAAATTSMPRLSVFWVPCERGTHLHHGACVHVEKRLVAAPAPAPVEAAVPATAVTHAPARTTHTSAAKPARPHPTATSDDHESDDDGHGDD